MTEANEYKEYRVSWEIDVSAQAPEEAARQAVNYLAPMEPGRWCYMVRDNETGEVSKHEGEDLF